jgi:hypothetical protein
MTKIYDQHRSAFANVSAYVVLKDGQRVATVAFKFGNAVTAYVHWFGTEMTKGRACGGGYDRQSAAVASAARRELRNLCGGATGNVVDFNSFWRACEKDGGASWDRALTEAGFTVLQAV